MWKKGSLTFKILIGLIGLTILFGIGLFFYLVLN